MPIRLMKMLCCLLMLTALFLISSAALADSDPWADIRKTESGMQSEEVYVYTYNLNVYEKPNKNSEVLEIVPFAKRILFLAEKKGWAKVYTTNGRTGYCNVKKLTDKDPNTYSEVVYCQTNRAPFYLRPSLDAPLMGHLDRNEKTTLFAVTPKHDWMRIKVGKRYVYIQRPYIDFEKYEECPDAWVNVQSLPVYYDTNVDSSFATAYFGQHVYLAAQDGGWAKIHSDSGLIGYCTASALSDIDPNSLDIVVYTQVAGSYLYESSTDLSGHRPIAANVEMLLCAVDDNLHWARVRYDDRYYYVPYVCLSTEQRRGDYKLVRASTDLSIREGTTQASKIITNVPAGTTLMLVGCSDNCAKVSTMPAVNGVRFIGFVRIDQIQ